MRKPGHFTDSNPDAVDLSLIGDGVVPKAKTPDRKLPIGQRKPRQRQRLPPSINVAISTIRDMVRPIGLYTIRFGCLAPDRFAVFTLSIVDLPPIGAVRIGPIIERLIVSIAAWVGRFPTICQDLAMR